VLIKRWAGKMDEIWTGSEMIENGVAPSVVQRQMRHSDSCITLQKYAHVIGDAQRRAVDSLAHSVLELTR
jgi:hypothetical protein